MNHLLRVSTVMILSLALIGCAPPAPEPATAAPTASPTPLPTDTPITDLPTLEIFSPTAAVIPPRVTLTATPISRATGNAPAYPIPTAPPGGLVIHSFTVTPSTGLKQGDIIEVAWDAEGISAKLCISAYDYYGGTCVDVPLSGTRPLTISWSEGIGQVSLTVDTGPGGPLMPAVQSYVEIDLGCSTPWVFDALAERNNCPAAAETWNAAAELFEHGWMIYNGSQYLIFSDAPADSAPAGKIYAAIYDPLDITGDTSADYTAPAGLRAPISGFGIVWRGDASQSPGYQSLLGWAVAPEFNTSITQQCWVLRGYISAIGGISTCYLTLPDGTFVSVMQNGFTFYWQPAP